MSISDWPAGERPREKLLHGGAKTLSDAELLALLLGSGAAGSNALDLARQLLLAYGGLRPLLNAPRDVVCATRGVGHAKYAQLQAGLELGRRVLAERLKRTHVVKCPGDARDYLMAVLGDRPHEVFACLFLDTRHRITRFEEMFRGTIDGASVHPREVVKAALQYNAAALIAAHNHPSGVAEPSAADEQLTRRLKDALALVDVRLLDHIIVGDGQAVSLSERGVI